MLKTQKKSDYGQFIEMVNEIATTARNNGITHLYTTDESYSKKEINFEGFGKPLINFGSCSYLGLETDDRLKEGAVDKVLKYGSQVSCSRTYFSCTAYKELEENLSRMFEANIILNVNSSSSHLSVIPIIVEAGDAVIFDQQAHISMQECKYKLMFNGVTVEFLKHSKLDDLQEKINRLSSSHNRIWYFLDGVYSMFGDLAPIKELSVMQEHNEKLHLYIDDAHSMSIFGQNGTGYILSQVKQNPRMIISVSLAKGFGSAGGVTIFKDDEMYWKVKNWGGCLTYSGPQQPAVLGASIASSIIHLSDEIYDLQKELMDNVVFCNELINQYQLPLISESNTPIFFIGLGFPNMGYKMVQRLMQDGFYLNIGIFPAVSERNTGLRFTITRNHSKDDISRLIERIHFQLTALLEEEGRSMVDIYKAFRSIQKNKYIPRLKSNTPTNKTSKFKIQIESSIKGIPKNLWNELYADKGIIDWDGLALLEEVFKNNVLEEDNWKFIYYIVRDDLNKPVVATFLTSVLTKDDMLSFESKSKEIEQKRIENAYYLTSKSFMMGSLISEGQHLFIDRTNSNWKDALKELIDLLWEEQEKQGCNNLFLRDFDVDDVEIKDLLKNKFGFQEVTMPSSNIIDVTWSSTEEYISLLSKKNRQHLKKNVLSKEHQYQVEIVKNATEEQIANWYQLYENVRKRNLTINGFKLPLKFFQIIANSPSWECMQFSIQHGTKSIPIAVIFAYKNSNYSNTIVGLDYTYLEEYEPYRQTLYQTIVRAAELGAKKIFLGLTADFEKQKVGAKTLKRVAYVQMKDSFNIMVLSSIPSQVA